MLSFCVNFLSAQSSDIFLQQSDTLQIAKTNKSAILKKIEIGIPSVMVAYGLLSFGNGALKHIDNSTRYEAHEDSYLLYHRIDDYLQFSPAATAFLLKFSGVESNHKLSDMVAIYALSNLLETSVVYTTKSVTKRMRPDGSQNNSFPSGHTATAFVAAEFLFQEYKNKSISISIGGYTMASLIGVSRILKDKHWASDVVAGAGVGILSTKVVYWTYPSIKKIFNKKNDNQHLDNYSQTFIAPFYNSENWGLNLSHRF